MRHKTISLTDFNGDIFSFQNYNYGDNNSAQINEMKKIMRKAIKYELTPKQRHCLCEYYLNGKSMKKIASELSVHPSTVTRHIQKAVSRLKRVARYY